MKHDVIDRVIEYLGMEVTPSQLELLQRYTNWLVEEAIPAGGLGPMEQNRIERRHIADSLLFAVCFPIEPEWIRDIGSGVGLPGIPLAILLPETSFELVDRSGRRVDLMKRAVRILELGNVTVVQNQVEDIVTPSPVMVSRAVSSPVETAQMTNRLLTVGGTAVLGGSWVKRPIFAGWETVEIPSMVLDQQVWLLMMRRQ